MSTDKGISHSCYPNIKVYAVIFDSVPDAGEVRFTTKFKSQ